MKRFGLVLVLAAAALFIWGDPAGMLQRVSMWSCQWLHVARGC
jgi:hypothetical protein